MAAPYLKRRDARRQRRSRALDDRSRPTARCSILPDERLRQNSLPFAAGPYRYLRVTWDDTNSARVANPTAVEARSAGLVSAPRADDVLGDNRAPSERTGAQPLSRSTSGTAAADRGARSRRRRRDDRRPRLSAGDRQRVALRGSRGSARRARTGDAHARHARRADGRCAPDSDCAALGGRARLDDRGRRKRGPGRPRRFSRACRAAVDLLRSAGWRECVARYGDLKLPAAVYDLEAARNTIDLAKVPQAKFADGGSAAHEPRRLRLRAARPRLRRGHRSIPLHSSTCAPSTLPSREARRSVASWLCHSIAMSSLTAAGHRVDSPMCGCSTPRAGRCPISSSGATSRCR